MFCIDVITACFKSLNKDNILVDNYDSVPRKNGKALPRDAAMPCIRKIILYRSATVPGAIQERCIQTGRGMILRAQI
jgi:hypothetical protein